MHGCDEDVQSTIADMNVIVTCPPTSLYRCVLLCKPCGDTSQPEVASKLNALVKNIMSSRDSLLTHLSDGDKKYLSTP
eukprot:3123954-Amphidinium_carterae.1